MSAQNSARKRPGCQMSPQPPTTPVRAAHRIDLAALERYLARHVPDAVPIGAVSQFAAGQSNPTYLIEGPARRFRAAQEAAGHAAAVRPPGRAGIPHPRGAGRDRRARAARPSPLRGHRHYRHGLLRDGLCGGIGRSGPGLACVCGGSPQRAYDSMADVLARLHSGIGGGWASATTARKATTSRARSAAGVASTRPRAPTRSPKWTACSRGSPTTSPTMTRPPSSTATTGRVT